MNESEQSWTRWLIAILDALSFGWFIMTAIVMARLLMHRTDAVMERLNPDVCREPAMTSLARVLLPESNWSLMGGTLCLSIGFSLLSFTSNESSSSRVFRWVAILAMPLLAAASLPVLDSPEIIPTRSHMPFPMGDVLYLIFGVMMLILCGLFIRKPACCPS